jgi:hypothetical protein
MKAAAAAMLAMLPLKRRQLSPDTLAALMPRYFRAAARRCLLMLFSLPRHTRGRFLLRWLLFVAAAAA